ncbi:glycosyltransferase family 2 protein [Planotetraspora mira]|jgi:hypothetical protein|uniref:Glycosyltransferase 2-like domain-containing protein n=1 Tax=Planotetraspora mira TaxID=58121 RepID=A0A8J3TV29_9ACTN|nr:glycosyltransferase [Planotetraspora mira]GII31019.1 hypothetical protein Pmi06nite_44610 [Planotetraspora mira]
MISPQGFLRAPSAETAEARWDGSQWIISGTAFPDGLTEGDVAGLRDLRDVRIEWPQSSAPLDVIHQLASAGVPLHSAAAPDWLDPDLRDLVTDARWLEPEIDGTGASLADLRREEHSLRLRRLGLRRSMNTSERGLVSVIVASRRPALTAFTLAQIARQRHVDLEVVYAAHGFPAEVVRQEARDFPFPIEIVELGSETVFGEVINAGVARANGGYIAKWDDDDWYSPDHLSDLLLAKEYSGADVVGMPTEFYYLEPLDITVRRGRWRTEITADLVSGATLLLERTTFQEIGGFQPVPQGGDTRLLKAIEAAGGTIYRTHGMGLLVRRAATAQHTWQPPLSEFIRGSANQWRGFHPTRILEGS